MDRGLRTNKWLRETLLKLWSNHFPHVPVGNPVKIEFGRSVRTRLGSIRLRKDGVSHIYINGIFRDPATPEVIVNSIIAHELIHYAQGFSSKLPRTNRHPHAGGAIAKGMIRAGLHDMLKFEKKWVHAEWPGLIDKKIPRTRVKRSVVRRKRQKLLRFIFSPMRGFTGGTGVADPLCSVNCGKHNNLTREEGRTSEESILPHLTSAVTKARG